MQFDVILKNIIYKLLIANLYSGEYWKIFKIIFDQ